MEAPHETAFAIRDQMNDIEEAPGKVWFWELERAVIDAGRCIECGACIAACPSDSLGIGADDLPKLVKMCTGCSLCWDFCPRGGLRYEALGDLVVETASSGVGARHAVARDGHGHAGCFLRRRRLRLPRTSSSPHHAATGHAARAVALPRTAPLHVGENGHVRDGNGHNGSNGTTGITVGRGWRRRGSATRPASAPTIPGVQDGGVVSALLIALLEAGRSTARWWPSQSEREPWKGVAHLARTPEEVVACAGSFYNQTLALGHLDLKKYNLPPNAAHRPGRHPLRDPGVARHAGAPVLLGGLDGSTPSSLTIALLCTKSFHYEGLMLQEIQAKRGISLLDIDKIDIIRGKLYLYDEQGVTLLEEPIRDFHGAALKGCDECADFLGRAADISAGSVGSADGYSSILIWTDDRPAAFQHVVPRLEIRDLERPQAIEKLDALDKTVAFANLQASLRPARSAVHRLRGASANYAGTIGRRWL